MLPPPFNRENKFWLLGQDRDGEQSFSQTRGFESDRGCRECHANLVLTRRQALAWGRWCCWAVAPTGVPWEAGNQLPFSWKAPWCCSLLHHHGLKGVLNVLSVHFSSQSHSLLHCSSAGSLGSLWRIRVIPEKQRDSTTAAPKGCPDRAGGSSVSSTSCPVPVLPSESTASVRRRWFSTAEQLQEWKVPLTVPMPWIRLAAGKIHISSPVWDTHRDH